MTAVAEFFVSPQEAFDDEKVHLALLTHLRLKENNIYSRVVRRSLDARKNPPCYWLRVEYDIYPLPLNIPRPSTLPLTKEAIVVGTGPAGLFAALTLLSKGIKPILLERGKDVKSRRRDLAAITRQGEVNPDSNYCFGEGGAGTYSDGKLYTRSGKRGNIQKVLETFVHFGAHGDILIDAHPHIGTNHLPGVIQNIRQFIIAHGGEVHFEKKIVSLILDDNAIQGVECADGSRILASAVILATGHSARDIFSMLHNQQIPIEAKPFALGVRIEHPQSLINQIQYHHPTPDPLLPPASYSLVTQSQGRGVFSFCMCPGGIIAPAATSPGEIVVNGWSPSKRNNPKANSGLVVSVDHEDFNAFKDAGPLAGMVFQQWVEQKAFQAGGGKLKAPAQSVQDFLKKTDPIFVPESSYLPGITAYSLWDVLPSSVSQRLYEGLIQFGKTMKGYLGTEAVMLATESRTSSPVKIPRDPLTCQHPAVNGLYPCGEGAGYAGGIVSAAMDGIRCAEKLAEATIKV